MFPKNPCSDAGLVQKYIGSAYDNVKTVAGNIEDVKTASTNIDDVNKVGTNIGDIKYLSQNIPEYRVSEDVILSNGQTVVNTTKVITSACEVQVSGQRVDNQSLFRDRDYTVTGGNQITLKRKYPMGTMVKFIR